MLTLQCAAMPAVTLGQIADFLGADFSGDRDFTIRGVKPLSEAAPDELSFLANPKYAAQLDATRAGAVLIKEAAGGYAGHQLVVADPYFALVRVVREWFATVPRPAGISDRAAISRSARIADDAAIGALTSIADDVVIGRGVVIYDNVSIGHGSVIGDGTIVYPNVTIYHGSVIGERCIIHSGVVIGADGYGFATLSGVHHKLPQIGIVRIGDDVEIGANSTIDRAALGATVIGDGTKIDNLVMIAHNVKIGKHCLLVAQSGIAGSTELGDHVVFGGQAGAAGHLKIGDGVQVAAQAAVMKDYPGPAKLGGSPARPLSEYLRVEASLRRVPELIHKVHRLEQQLKQIKND
jgi:UDP-3-O-[3-hydroxymyristoyl] glucosamine N-acyltransferase